MKMPLRRICQWSDVANSWPRMHRTALRLRGSFQQCCHRYVGSKNSLIFTRSLLYTPRLFFFLGMTVQSKLGDTNEAPPHFALLPDPQKNFSGTGCRLGIFRSGYHQSPQAAITIKAYFMLSAALFPDLSSPKVSLSSWM